MVAICRMHNIIIDWLHNKNGIKTKEFWDGKISCEKTPLRLKIRNICGDETIWEIDNTCSI